MTDDKSDWQHMKRQLARIRTLLKPGPCAGRRHALAWKLMQEVEDIVLPKSSRKDDGP